MTPANFIISTANNYNCLAYIKIVHGMTRSTTWRHTILFKFYPFSWCHFLIIRLYCAFEEPKFVAKLPFFIITSKEVNSFFNTLTKVVLVCCLLEKGMRFRIVWVLSDSATLCLYDGFDLLFVIVLVPFVVLEIIYKNLGGKCSTLCLATVYYHRHA